MVLSRLSGPIDSFFFVASQPFALVCGSSLASVSDPCTGSVPCAGSVVCTGDLLPCTGAVVCSGSVVCTGSVPYTEVVGGPLCARWAPLGTARLLSTVVYLPMRLRVCCEVVQFFVGGWPRDLSRFH